MKDTYGKHYASMYTGSMVGAGPCVFAVMGYIIANKDESGKVELNPPLLAYVLGATPEQVQSAIDYLMAPDPNSRTKTHDGRRIIRVGQFLYQVVNHDLYTRKRSKDRTEYWKKYKREKRTKADMSTVSTVDKVDNCGHSTMSTHVDVDVDVSEEKNPPLSPQGGKAPGKQPYGEFVRLTEEEHGKLVERFGTEGTTDRIARLDAYVGSTGKPYKSHYHTIISWEQRATNNGKATRRHDRDYSSRTSKIGDTICV